MNEPLPQQVVIAGGGLAGVAAIESLRSLGYEGSIRLISEESELPYDRPPLSKGYLGGQSLATGLLLHDAAWYRDQRVDVALGSRVTSLDAARRRVHINESAGHDVQYDRLPQWIADPRLQSDSGRADHGEFLSERTQRWIENLSTEDALTRLEAARIPAGPLYSPLQTLDDPQVKATGLVEWIDYPGLPKRAPVAIGPIEFSAFGTKVQRPPPTLGEHTVEILKEIGYADADIIALRAQRVV